MGKIGGHFDPFHAKQKRRQTLLSSHDRDIAMAWVFVTSHQKRKINRHMNLLSHESDIAHSRFHVLFCPLIYKNKKWADNTLE